MNRRQLPLDRNGATRIEVVWDSGGEDARVFFDGAQVHQFPNPASFMRGAIVALPDGSELRVRLRGFVGLDVRRNGVALPGSDMDPAFVLNRTSSLMFMIGGIGLAFEAEKFIRATSDDERLFFGFQAMGDVVFLLLAFLTKRGSRFALGVAVVMVLVSFGFSFSFHRGIVATIWSGCVFAILAQRFSASEKSPKGSTGPIAQPVDRVKRHRKRDAYDWPSRFDDDAK